MCSKGKLHSVAYFCINIKIQPISLTLLHPEWPKLYAILAFLSAIGLKELIITYKNFDMGDRGTHLWVVSMLISRCHFLFTYSHL